MLKNKFLIDLTYRFGDHCRFVSSVADYRSLPILSQLEITVIGRSNCGKSSLLNNIMGRKNLVFTSKTPGCTKLFNIFAVKEELLFVDLPGYGYAQAIHNQQHRWLHQWLGYLNNRVNLRYILVLIDSRRGIMPIDHIMMSNLDKQAKSYSIVLTKLDKLSISQHKHVIANTRKALLQHSAAEKNLFLSSNKSYLNVNLLRHKILDVCGLLDLD